MLEEKLVYYLEKLKLNLKENFRFSTLNFIFIIAFVNIFQLLFGTENSIVGVIFTIMMSASMARDLTAAPIKHFLLQALTLVAMAAAACLVTVLPPWAALPVNLLMIFIILYAYTYEYASHLYFPYILSYLFLIFISPVTPDQLPKRLLGMLTGAVCIIFYQFFMGRKRAIETARDVLSTLLAEAQCCIDCLLTGKGKPDTPEKVRENLCRLSRMIYERRKRILCISDASFAMLDVGRGLENLILSLYEMEGPATEERAALLSEVSRWLQYFQGYVHRECAQLPSVSRSDFLTPEDPMGDAFFRLVSYIRIHLLRMTQPEHRTSYRKTVLSFSVRLKAALNFSPVRFTYALRVGLLLALGTLLTQLLGLPHGKWLLFTIASVSLPYADDVGTKGRKRMLATLIGGLAGALCYTLVPSPAGRTAIMMLSGYLSFYFSDYTGTFACSTVGALGGAVFMNAFGLGPVGAMLLIRLAFVGLGILLAWFFNCRVFPFSRRRALRQLWEKYAATNRLLTRICRTEDADAQLYFSLVLQSHMQEEKLVQNALAEGFDGMRELLEKCRREVRAAHRQTAGRTEEAPA